ncbi:M28 family peptidase [bacterium]|nr:M28 family peptidase [bacterium]
MSIFKITTVSLCLSFSLASFAQKAILADQLLLDQAGIKVIYADDLTGLAYAEINDQEEGLLQKYAHALGKCGGFEALSQDRSLSAMELDSVFFSVQVMNTKMMRLASQGFVPQPEFSEDISTAVAMVSKERIKKHVEWLSSFHSRNHKRSNANEPIQAVADYLVANLPSNYEVSLIDHSSTRQKSIRVRLQGAVRQDEIVVLGGHIDSIVQSIFDPDPRSPGADDNASGSADVMETMFILAEMGFQPARSLEFFFYAGEESGLLGSAEIAESYKNAGKDVVGVMQLDMTSFAGSGELVFSNMTDFTDPTLRSFIENLNNLYVGGTVIHSKCGYGCSDHASWYRRGYPTVMPFESHMDDYNSKIHSKNDIIDSNTNFEHAAMFAKLAVSYVMELSSNSWRPGSLATR